MYENGMSAKYQKLPERITYGAVALVTELVIVTRLVALVASATAVTPMSGSAEIAPVVALKA